MHYRIVYGKDKRRFPMLTKRQKVMITTAAVCIAMTAVCLLWGTQWLLPGDPQVSGAALENMADSLQNGESLADAVVAFCQEIVANAQMP